MIKPINAHVLIEPIAHDTFVQSNKKTYEEIGIVITRPKLISDEFQDDKINVGDKVYFDSWLAAKYPKGTDEYYWLVPYSSIRAYESVSEQ